MAKKPKMRLPNGKINPAWTKIYGDANPKTPLAPAQISKVAETKLTRKEKFDKWREKHAGSLRKIEKAGELGAAAIQEGGFTSGLGVGTGGGGMITKGAPLSAGGDEYQDYQTASDKLKKRKTSGY